MLRRPGQSESYAEAFDEAAFPSLEEPFTLEDRSYGVRFYKGRESFFHPYAVLQSMRLRSDTLSLTFATADVVLTGRALHTLYVHLASQRVVRIVEQGERYRGVADATTFISRIEEVLR